MDCNFLRSRFCFAMFFAGLAMAVAKGAVWLSAGQLALTLPAFCEASGYSEGTLRPTMEGKVESALENRLRSAQPHASAPPASGMEEIERILRGIENGDISAMRDIAWLDDLEERAKLIEAKERLIRALAQNLGHEDWNVRDTAREAIVRLAQHEVFHDAIKAHVIPALAQNLGRRNPNVRAAAQRVIAKLALFREFHKAMLDPDANIIKELAQSLEHEDWRVRFTAQDAILSLAEHEVFHDAIKTHVIPALAQNLGHNRDKDVRATAQEAILSLAEHEAFHDAIKTHVIPALAPNLRRENADVRKIAQEAILSLAQHEVFHDAIKTHVIPALAQNLGHRDRNVRATAQEAIAKLAQFPAFHPAMLEANIIKKLAQNLGHANEWVRITAQEAIASLAQHEAFQEIIKIHIIIPALAQNLRRKNADVRKTAQETIASLAEHEAFQEAINTHLIPALARNLGHSDKGVRATAREAILSLAPFPAFHPAMLDNNVIQKLAENLEYEHSWVRATAQEAIAKLAQFPAFHQAIRQFVPQPQQLGFPEGLTWEKLGLFNQVWGPLLADPNSSLFKLSLGARAALRWKLLLFARRADSEEALRQQYQRWLQHLLIAEVLDEALGLPSVGAEIHTDPDDPRAQAIRPVVHNLASGVGDHAIQPVQVEGGGDIAVVDYRLLPAYPTTFPILLKQLMEVRQAKGLPGIDAHYTVGVDLGRHLATLAFLLFYGDPDHIYMLPIEAGEADVGFPGAYTYRGQSIDIRTGNLIDLTQSNLNIRPLKTIVSVEGEIVPEALFYHDLEAVAFLSKAATASPDSPLHSIFQDLLRKWEDWLRDLGGDDLLKKVRSAEDAAKGRSGQGLTPELDKASKALFEKLHTVTPKEFGRTLGRVADLSEKEQRTEEEEAELRQLRGSVRQWVEEGKARREELAQLIRETQNEVWESMTVTEGVGTALKEYRDALREDRALEELERLRTEALNTINHAILDRVKARGRWAPGEFPEQAQLRNLRDAILQGDRSTPQDLVSLLGQLVYDLTQRGGIGVAEEWQSLRQKLLNTITDALIDDRSNTQLAELFNKLRNATSPPASGMEEVESLFKRLFENLSDKDKEKLRDIGWTSLDVPLDGVVLKGVLIRHDPNLTGNLPIVIADNDLARIADERAKRVMGWIEAGDTMEEVVPRAREVGAKRGDLVVLESELGVGKEDVERLLKNYGFDGDEDARVVIGTQDTIAVLPLFAYNILVSRENLLTELRGAIRLQDEAGETYTLILMA